MPRLRQCIVPPSRLLVLARYQRNHLLYRHPKNYHAGRAVRMAIRLARKGTLNVPQLFQRNRF